MTHCLSHLAPDLAVYSLIGPATSHLLVRRGHSLLIDCHTPHLARWLDRRALPHPELILHTHVQPEHCHEAATFPHARILVHEQLAQLAADRPAYDRASHTTWDHPAEWPVTLGREAYGVAGSVTSFPPSTPLTLAGTFRDDDRLTFQDLTLRVVPLPGHSRHHVGFLLELDGAPLALFSGDLLRDPATLVNVYDLEVNYGGTALSTLPPLLRSLADRPVQSYFPATGPPISNGPAQACQLADAIDAYQHALTWNSGTFQAAPQPEYPRVGRYRQLHRGVYQIDNFGNVILLIDDLGRGLMVDPGPCDFESPARYDDFQRDLDLFERTCGLRSIDLALVTHPHGDHYDMVPTLRKRYPGCRLAAWDLVGRVIEAPWDYPYPALLPWYNLGFDHVPVDNLLHEDQPYAWHDLPIRTLHLPGHCYCHAGYLLTFNGLRLAFTGDTVQTRGWAESIGFIIANHSIPGPHAGNLKAYRALAAQEIDLNIGGHGSHFTHCRDLYAESVRRIEHALPYLQRLVPHADLPTAFLRPSFPHWPGTTA